MLLDLFQARFLEEVLLDLYHGKDDIRFLIENFEQEYFPLPVDNCWISLDSFARLEESIAKQLSLPSLGVAKALFNAQSWNHIRWNCKVIFNSNDPFSLKYRVRYGLPRVEASTSLFAHCLSADRFLFVSMSGFVPSTSSEHSTFVSQYWDQHWAEMKLFERGIVFGGRRYVFLGGEMEKNASKDGLGSSLSTWFVSVSDTTSSIKTMKNFIPVDIVRDFLGDLSALPAGKCNARLKLGFSSILPFDLDEDQIMLIPDISNEEGKVMTDGCGFISYTLAKHFPYGVSHGSRGVTVSGKRGDAFPAPSIVQVRCISGKGLFKGCLIVTNDKNHCPENCIVFRESMRKSDPSPYVMVQEGELRLRSSQSIEMKSKAMLGLVDTFEHQNLLTKESQRELSDFSAKLNRSLCLLLHSLGVPRKAFLTLMQGEIDQLLAQSTSLQNAFHLARRSLESVKQQGIKWYETDEVQDDEETDHTSVIDDVLPIQPPIFSVVQQNTVSSFEVDHSPSLAERIIEFIFAGHSIDEPHFNQLYNRLKLQKLKYLSRCNIVVRNAMYLVGAPDPYQLLQPGEVFILPPNDRDDIKKSTTFNLLPIVRSRVVVTRHPMQHPGDIRIFSAVDHPKLAHLAQIRNLTNGGIIFFSTLGNRSPGDEMSGGDYDGDRYLVLYGQDIVPFVNVIPPNNDNELQFDINEGKAAVFNEVSTFRDACHHKVNPPMPSIVDNCQLCLDPIGVNIFRKLLLDCQYQHVGKYSNAWLAYADVDPLSKEALICGYIVRVALDAAKSGKAVPSRLDLLRKAPLKRYLRQEVSPIIDPTITETSSTMSLLSEDDQEFDIAYQKAMHGNVNDADVDQIDLWIQNCNLDDDSEDLVQSPSSVTSRKSILEDLFNMVTYAIPASQMLSTSNECVDIIPIDWDLLIVEDDDKYNAYEYCQRSCSNSYLREHIFEIFPKFASELNFWFVRVTEYKQRLAAILSQSKLNADQKEKKCNELKREHLLSFDQRAAYVAETFYQDIVNADQSASSMREKLARLRSAGFVYLATYFTAAMALEKDPSRHHHNSSSYISPTKTVTTKTTMLSPSRDANISSHANNFALSYCWEVCGHELHYNKFQIEKRKQNQHSLHTILRSVTRIL